MPGEGLLEVVAAAAAAAGKVCQGTNLKKILSYIGSNITTYK